ncbi:hypothetical protein GNP84_06460 [Aliivibrio fischeri]|uniref:hypothetical protein n=1 Tax=Aliivibrio fischeri TaxID=668 RepID=UPI0012D9E483|nr:hypothetical protein [Aliivibrio fischeri]MUK76547.1 hypothetical protein [Aliivibrio fischeri]
MLSKKEHQDLIVLRFIDAYVDLYGELNTGVIDLSKKRYVKSYTFEKVFLVNESSFLYLNAIELIYS